MRQIFVILLFMCSVAAFTQSPVPNGNSDLLRARSMMDKRFSTYDPFKALALYKQLADAGNPEAMNALGIIYSRGLCDSVNHAAALRWFGLSAEGGYANAWTNLGIMYKDGLGTEQDMAKAYQCFSTGAGMGSPSAIYSQGYMLYKGLGCVQSYEKAVALFRKSIPMGSLGSMYMLGLCYRNGYGITQNADSARYWLLSASEAGYRPAADELMTKEPENTSVAATSVKKVQSKSGVKNPTTYTSFKKIKHQLRSKEPGIGGYYTGYAIKYDWSGKNAIGKSCLTLQLSQKDSLLVGMWVED
ncbi:MAG: tetratricopeptide repeat protein, partial [Bacteroidota bacterium]|nr:tetratricopeptide repeat protein [Bacteroidota bacterium]